MFDVELLCSMLCCAFGRVFCHRLCCMFICCVLNLLHFQCDAFSFVAFWSWICVGHNLFICALIVKHLLVFKFIQHYFGDGD